MFTFQKSSKLKKDLTRDLLAQYSVSASSDNEIPVNTVQVDFRILIGYL